MLVSIYLTLGFTNHLPVWLVICLHSVGTTSAARGYTRVAKGRVHDGLWMLARIAQAAVAERLGLMAPFVGPVTVVLQSRS